MMMRRLSILLLLCCGVAQAQTTTDFTASVNDGFIVSQDVAYATARNSPSALSAFSTITPPVFGVGQYVSGGQYGMQLGYLDFDTSTLPDIATITSVTLFLTYYDAGACYARSFDLVVREYDWSGNINADAAQDWAGCRDAANTNDTIFDTIGTSGPTFTQHSHTLRSGNFEAGTGWVRLAGHTRYCVLSSRFIASDPPAAAGCLTERQYSDDSTTGADAPILRVVYSTGPTATPTNTNTPIATQTPTVNPATPTRLPTNTSVPGGVPTYTPVPRCGEALPQ